MPTHIQYLTFDSLEEGVGSSQVLSYLLRFSKDFEITLINLEKTPPSVNLLQTMADSGITWIPISFGNRGLVGGLFRLARIMKNIDKSKVTHARGDFAALAALLKGNTRTMWDCRAFTPDQRKSISQSKTARIQYYGYGLIEKYVARRVVRINVITFPAAKILARKYDLSSHKFSIISTCVDLNKFQIAPMRTKKPIKILLPGTLSHAYDFDLMNKIIGTLRTLIDIEVTIALSKGATELWRRIDSDKVISLRHDEMPDAIAEHHFGMSIWKANLGIALASVSSTKVPEFLAVGRPVIVNFNQGDIGNWVEQYNCGVSTSLAIPEYVDRYAKKILELINDGETPTRCRKLAEERFSLESAVAQLTSIYHEMSAAENLTTKRHHK